jgi:Icc protein
VIKLGIVGDIHWGPDTESMRGSSAPAMLETFAAAMREFRPDAIVDLGDRITDVSAAEDRERTTWVRRQLLALGIPVFHVLGNHDVAHVAKTELGDALGKHGPYECGRLDGVRVVVLDSQDPTIEGVGGSIGTVQQRWLAETLAEGTLPALVFCHHPLDEQNLEGHWYFAEHPAHALVREREVTREILSRSGRVMAVFSGHMHWTRSMTVDRIPYVTLGSLVDAGFTGGQPAGTFACVTVQEKTVDVQVAGFFSDQLRLAAGVQEGSSR